MDAENVAPYSDGAGRESTQAANHPEIPMTATATNTQIAALRTEADRAGDFEQSALCVLALGGRDALRGAERGTEWARLFTSRRTQTSARRACANVIAEMRA